MTIDEFEKIAQTLRGMGYHAESVLDLVEDLYIALDGLLEFQPVVYPDCNATQEDFEEAISAARHALAKARGDD